MFIDYQPAFEHVSKGCQTFIDVANHCKNYDYFKVAGDVITTVHESSHGIASDLRNSSIMNKATGVIKEDKRNLMPLWIPDPKASKLFSGQNQNGFYCLNNQAIKITEPNCRKSSALKFVPNKLKYYRYQTYMTGQTEWDDSPLYVFDEAVAYCNGAQCAIDIGCKDGTDWIFPVIEFIPYTLAVLMAAKEVSFGLDSKLTDFAKWHYNRCLELYNKGRTNLPWPQMEECLDILRNDNSDEKVIAMREFAKSVIGFNFNLDVEPADPNFMV